MKRTDFYKIVAVSLGIIPTISLAQNYTGLYGFLVDIRGLLGILPPVIFGIAIVFFFWGGAQFVLHAGDEKYRADGKKKLIWGVVALFVFVSIYGILAAVGDLIGIPATGIHP